MSLPAGILETILTRLAPLFLIGTGGDPTAARQAASQMLAAYRPETEDELCLAASIIGFSFQVLEALSQAADPDLPVTRIIRLRGSAVSLSRESEKTRRRLTQLQQARQQAAQAEIHREPAPAPEPAPTLAPKPAPGQPKAQTAVPPAPPRPQTEERRQEDLRIAASIKRAEAKIAALAAAEASGPPPTPPTRTLTPAL